MCTSLSSSIHLCSSFLTLVANKKLKNNSAIETLSKNINFVQTDNATNDSEPEEVRQEVM